MLWFATGVPVAGVLYFLPFTPIVWCVIAFVALQAAHQMSPIAMAWLSPAFRRVMLEEWREFLLLPMAVLLAGISAPFAWTAGLYFAWNIYHYAMQHFGVLALCRQVPPRWRTEIALGVVLATVLVFLIPHIARGQLVTALFLAGGVNHWVVDLWLSRRVTARPWMFLLIASLFGLVGFVIWEPSAHGVHPRAEWLVQIGMALGFVHFLYSRWVWQSRYRGYFIVNGGTRLGGTTETALLP